MKTAVRGFKGAVVDDISPIADERIIIPSQFTALSSCARGGAAFATALTPAHLLRHFPEGIRLCHDLRALQGFFAGGSEQNRRRPHVQKCLYQYLIA